MHSADLTTMHGGAFTHLHIQLYARIIKCYKTDLAYSYVTVVTNVYLSLQAHRMVETLAESFEITFKQLQKEREAEDVSRVPSLVCHHQAQMFTPSSCAVVPFSVGSKKTTHGQTAWSSEFHSL